MLNLRSFRCLVAALLLVASSSIWAATVAVIQYSTIQNDDLEASVYKVVRTPGYPAPPPTEDFFLAVSPMKDTGGSMNYIYGESIGGNTLNAGQECKCYVKRKDGNGNYIILVSTQTLYAQ